MNHKFSMDFKSLAYVCSEGGRHSGGNKLKQFSWPLDGSPSKTIVDCVDLPSDVAEFGGLYGYHASYVHSGYLKGSNRYLIVPSDFKGQERIFLIDTLTGKVRHLSLDHVNAKKGGSYELMLRKDDFLIVKYSHTNLPSHVFIVRFKSIEENL